MSTEMETAGAASIGGLGAGGEADLSGLPCRNCGTMVEARHCPDCGQLAASFHRPFLTLLVDSISDAFAFDSRIGRTLPLLFFRPGTLTRRYIEGKRARYVPPFRLFLLSSLIFYFVVFTFLGQANWLDDMVRADITANEELTDEQLAELNASLLAEDGTVDTGKLVETMRRARAAEAEAAGGVPASSSEEQIMARVEAIQANPKLFMSAVQTWTPRLSLLLVPLTVFIFTILHFWRRRIYIYDHTIHALHIHSWLYLSATLAMVLSLVIGAGAAPLFFIALPLYVLFSLRNAYRSSTLLSIVRLILTLIVWIIGLSLLVVAILLTSALTI